MINSQNHAFPSPAEKGDFRRRIRRILETRHAMHIGELSQRLGLVEPQVRAELEGMMSRGEVERLRPLQYERDDQDFFRLCGLKLRTTIVAERWGHLRVCTRREYTRRTGEAAHARGMQRHVRLAGEAMACLAH